MKIHPLKQYRQDHGLTLFKMAKLTKSKSAGTIRDVETKRRKPSFKLAKAIVKVTKGAVSYTDLA
jgi:DNA-binding XRE family transcriptional regulator